MIANVDAVPLDTDDLPGYAIRLYDAYLQDPALVRLITWARLERTPTGNLFGDLAQYDERNLQQITEAQAASQLVGDIDPADLWALLISLAGTWAQASIVHAASSTEKKSLHDRRREALSSTTRRAFCADSG